MSISLAQWQQQGLYFTVNGERIFYRCSGNRHKPVLLLIHGFPTASWDLRHLWPVLSRDYCLVAADMPGFGFSAKPRSWQYSIALQADVQQALLRELNIQQFHILAHDYGDTVPLCLINGSDDPISGRHMAARYRELVGNTNITELEQVGHYPQLEAPAAVLAAWQNFMAAQQTDEQTL